MQEATAPKSSASRKWAKRTGFHEATHGKASYSASNFIKVLLPEVFFLLSVSFKGMQGSFYFPSLTIRPELPDALACACKADDIHVTLSCGLFCGWWCKHANMLN